jgi:3-oxoacyl-[acyl-carrier protein] reductase
VTEPETPRADGRFTLHDGVALVTGGSRNIGRAIAIALAEAGLAVAVNANHSVEEAQAVVAKITAAGGRATLAIGDVGDAEACERIVAGTEAQFGPIAYLVHSASRRRFLSIAEMTPQVWDETIRSNLSALYYLAHAVLPAMKRQRFGRVIALGGPDGYLGWHHRPANVAAKAALTGLVKAISFEYGYFGVTANVLVPGGTDTVRSAEDYPPDMLEQEGVPKGSPMLMIPRRGTVDELASACLFLASDAASYVTGQSLHVDGGLVMR